MVSNGICTFWVIHRYDTDTWKAGRGHSESSFLQSLEPIVEHSASSLSETNSLSVVATPLVRDTRPKVGRILREELWGWGISRKMIHNFILPRKPSSLVSYRRLAASLVADIMLLW